MRWVVRYLSYLVGVAALTAVSLVVAGGILMVAERLGPLSLDGPWISSASGPLGVPVTLALIYAVPLMIGGAAGCPMFRTIAQFGWLHALPWRVVGLTWALASCAVFALSFAIMSGIATVFETAAVFVILVLTAGFGWHVYAQRWVVCPDSERSQLEPEVV